MSDPVQRSPRPVLGEAPAGGVPSLASEDLGPRLPCVLLPTAGRLALALLCMLTARVALAGDGPRRVAGAGLHRARTPDLSVFVPYGAGAAAAWLEGGMRSGPDGGLRRARRASGAAPACAAEVCQPRVAVPGHEPRFRGGRTDVILALLSRSPLRPVSGLARRLADSNVRVDFSPNLGGSSDRGWGRLVVTLRWRLDASNAPVARPVN